MLRIAVLIRKWSVRGGNERVATELTRLLIARGHEVTVVCQKTDETSRNLVSESLVRRLPGLSFDPISSMVSFAIAAAVAVRRMRDRGQIDVTFGFNHTVEQDVYRLGGGTHAEFLELHRNTGKKSRHPWLDRTALKMERLRMNERQKTLFVAPSSRVRDELVRHYAIEGERVSIIPNGVDLVRFTPKNARADRQALRRVWGVEDDAPLALFVGQDLERKGFKNAVAAASRVRVPLVYVGPAERPSHLPKHVIWYGERRDVERCYRAADVLLLPSHYDPFGGVVLEAYASGLPAVASRRIGATELAWGTRLEEFLIEDPENVDELADRLAGALEASQRAEWRELARAVAEQAGMDSWASKIEAVLFRAVKSRD